MVSDAPVRFADMGVFADMEEQQLVVESGDAVVIPVPPHWRRR